MTRHLIRTLIPILTLIAMVRPAVSQGVGYLYWTSVTDTEVWRSRLDGNDLERVVGPRALMNPLSVDTVNGKLYFGAVADGVPGLWRADLDGSGQEQLVELTGELTDIDLDLAGGKVYWTEIWPAEVLRRANLDGSGVETLFSSADEIDGLALDLTATPLPRVYFVDVGLIKSVRLDGSDLQTLPLAHSSYYKLEVDGANDRIYYSTTIASESIGRANLDGSDVQILVSTGSDSSAVQLVGSQVYFRSGATLEVMDLDGGNRQPVLTAGSTIYGFWIDEVSGHVYLKDLHIGRMNLDGSNATPLVATVSSDLHDVAVTADGSVCFTTTVNDSITRVNADGSDPRPLDGDPVNDLRGLAIDRGAGQLYWVNLGGTVGRIGIDGSGASELLTGELQPHDIAVDPSGGAIYWTGDIYYSGDPTGVIRTAGLDGAAPAEVIGGLPRQIRGLDVDTGAGRLYFTDHLTDQIRRVDTNGAGLTNIIAATNPHDVAVDASGGKIFWTEGFGSSGSATTGKIRRANLDGSAAEDVHTGLSDGIRDLTVVYLPGAIFSDGFESGDTSAWSVSSP